MEPIIEYLYSNVMKVRPMRGKSNKDYHGRYTASEFAAAKNLMLENFREELGVGRIDKILKYCSQQNWPDERRDSYTYASANNVAYDPENLKYYDFAQDFLDEVHHGENFLRVWEEYDGIPESRREPDQIKLRAILIKNPPGGWAISPKPLEEYLKESGG